MAYKHTGPTPPGGWAPNTSQPLQHDGGIWQQQVIQPQNFNHYPFQPNMPMNNETWRLHQLRMLKQSNEMGMMGPPPVPQKPFGVPGPNPIAQLPNRRPAPSFPLPMMMNQGFQQEMLTKHHNEVLSLNRSQPHQNFSTSESLPFGKSPQPIISQTGCAMSWQQNGIPNDCSRPAMLVNTNDPASADGELRFVGNKNNGVLLDNETVGALVDSQALEAQLQEFLSSNTMTTTSTPMKTVTQASWIPRSTTKSSSSISDQSHLLFQHQPYPSMPTTSLSSDTATNLTQPPTQSDLRKIQSTSLQSSLSHMSPNQLPLNNHHPAPMSGDKTNDLVQRDDSSLSGSLSHSLQSLPSLSGSTGGCVDSQHESNILPSSNSLNSDKDKPKRRRRKRCGQCGPCQQKDDCGQCYVCKNKGQVNAICKSRKCLVLRKKVSS